VLLTLVSGVLTFAAVQQMDTTVAISRGQRLDVNAFGGEVTVRAWNRNTVRIEATTSGRDRVEISSSATAVSIRTQGRHGPPTEVQLTISAPAWVGLNLSGVNTGMRVQGVHAPISVETVEGEVDVTGGEGLISLRSVQGSVALRGARGRINLNSVNEDVSVSGSTGDVMAQTVNGEIDLQLTDAASVDASTVNGDIHYSGPIRNGGRYSLSTHNGDISLTVAEGTNASVAVSTFSGEFESEFPVPLRDTRQGKGFNFTLGSGSAQVTLESFQGTIELVRPGSERDRAHHRHEEDEDDHDR
jgi:Putative adhesin